MSEDVGAVVARIRHDRPPTPNADCCMDFEFQDGLGVRIIATYEQPIDCWRVSCSIGKIDRQKDRYRPRLLKDWTPQIMVGALSCLDEVLDEFDIEPGSKNWLVRETIVVVRFKERKVH